MNIFYKKKKTLISIGALVTSVCLLGGFLQMKSVKAESIDVSSAGVVRVENAVSKMETHTNENGNISYTGVTVGNGGESAYSGAFDGVFTGNLEIEYKFPGNSELSNSGDSMGDFTFRITSEKNPDQWFDIFIQSRYSKDTLKKDYYALETVIYGDYSIATGNTFDEDITYERYAWSGQAYDVGGVFNQVDASSKSTQAPKFNTNNAEDTEKLSFEINKNTGFLSIWYYTGSDTSVKKRLVEFNGDRMFKILEPFDTTEGYRISFSSDLSTKGKTYYVGTIGNSETTSSVAKSTDVCFLSLNGYSLQEDMLTVNALDGAEKSYVVNDRKLSTTQRNIVGLDSQATVYRYVDCQLYKDDTNNKAFSFTSKTPVDEFVTTTLGDYSKTVEGIQFAYSVGDYREGTSFANVSLNDDATARYVNKTVYTVHNYEGTLIQSDTAYSGQFTESFLGSTTIEYKFPGRSSVSHSNTNRNGKGDALGNFYFRVVSIANPDEWFEIRIQPMVNSDGTLSASKTSMKLITPYSKTETKDKVQVRCKYAGGFTSKSFAYPADLDSVNSWGNSYYALGPHFNTDLNDADGDFTEKLYFDVDDAGVMSIYYDMRGAGVNNKDHTFKNVGKYSWDPSSGYSKPLVTFNDTSSVGNTYFQFDLSQGYTISFGSDFDTDADYYDGLGNLIDLSSSGYQTIDGGTDIIFVSVGGLTLNKKDYAYVCENEISFDGNPIQDGDTISVTKNNINEPIIVKTEVYTNTDLVQVKTNKFYWHYTDLVDGVLRVEGDNFGEPFGFDVKVAYEDSDNLYYTVQYSINKSIISENYPLTQKSTVLSSAECTGKKFVGWYIKSLDGVYPEGYTYNILQGDILTAVFTEFSLLDGASIRLEAPYGIRYFSNIHTSEYNSLLLYLGKVNISTGIIVAPTDLIANNEFNHISCSSSSDFRDFKNLSVYDKAAEQLGALYDSKYLYYTGMYINIPETYIAREFSARAYLNIRYADGTNRYIYADYNEEKNSRSTFEIALSCIESGETGTILEDYISKTANITITDTTKQSWVFEEDIYSVCVNGIWVSEEGSSISIANEEYLITYIYDSATKTLTLSYDVIVDD